MTERSIFIAALDLPTDSDRAEYVDHACGDNDVLRSRVKQLLEAHATAGPFLDLPPIESVASVKAAAQDSDFVGSRIGPYKLLEQIGEGGMGVVYMAEQEEPVRRRVALKVVKPGMDSRQVIARFEAERQALAMMDHPNIARVLDAGRTESGRPYFVMELVHGVPITRYCDEAGLDLDARLGLFVSVCRAVQHAHQKGIIHRDLKPSNVLVTLYDSTPVPKVIDFGVAKAIEQRLTERTLFTNFGMLVGTFEYMAPEQAEMNALGVDTRSDIYSLGVLLYELLTGTTPVDRMRIRQAAFGEVLRMIQDEEPPPPSTRLSTSKSKESVRAGVPLDSQRLARSVRGELDWIAMRCLEKDRTRRYETAHELANDVERYLRDEPVSAGPPSALYRWRKYARRNRSLIAVATSVMVAIGVGSAVATVGFFQAKAERDRAELALIETDKQRKLAEDSAAAALRQAEKAGAVSQFLQDLFAATPAEGELTVRQLLNQSADALKRDGAERDPETEAAIRNVLGSAFSGLQMYSEAESQLRLALDIRERAYGLNHLEVAVSLSSLADMHVRQRQLMLAEPLARRALAIRLESLGPEHALVADTLNRLGYICGAQGNVTEAGVFSERALAIHQNIAGIESRATAGALYTRAIVLYKEGKFDQAEKAARKALRQYERYDGRESLSVARTLSFLGGLLHDASNPDAERMLRDSVAMTRVVGGDRHPELSARIERLVEILSEKGRHDEVQELRREQLQAQLAEMNDKIAANPADMGLYLIRADLHEQLLNFRDAAGDLKRFLASNPADHWHWFRCGAMYLYLGDRDSYEWCAREMSERFADNPHTYIGDRVAKLCLLDPQRGGDREFAVRLADRAVADSKHEMFFGWHKTTKAWAEYRAGRFETALQWSRRAQIEHAPLSAPCEATARLVACMAQYQLGDHESARKGLAEATPFVGPPLAERSTIYVGALTEFLLLDEARKLIGIEPTQSSETLHQTAESGG